MLILAFGGITTYFRFSDYGQSTYRFKVNGDGPKEGDQVLASIIVPCRKNMNIEFVPVQWLSPSTVLCYAKLEQCLAVMRDRYELAFLLLLIL